MANFTDDIKLLQVVKSQVDVEELKKDLTKLTEQAKRWQMNFDVDKYKGTTCYT